MIGEAVDPHDAARSDPLLGFPLFADRPRLRLIDGGDEERAHVADTDGVEIERDHDALRTIRASASSVEAGGGQKMIHECIVDPFRLAFAIMVAL